MKMKIAHYFNDALQYIRPDQLSCTEIVLVDAVRRNLMHSSEQPGEILLKAEALWPAAISTSAIRVSAVNTFTGFLIAQMHYSLQTVPTHKARINLYAVCHQHFLLM